VHDEIEKNAEEKKIILLQNCWSVTMSWSVTG